MKQTIIDDDNTEIEYKDKVFCIKTSDCELNFRTADSSIIQELGKKFSFSDWSAEIEINDNFKKLQKAIKLLPDEKYIYIKGDTENKKLNFTVKKTELDTNAFKSSFDCDIKKDVSIIINKDYFQIAESTKCKKMTLKIADRFICVECENDISTITFFIAKVS